MSTEVICALIALDVLDEPLSSRAEASTAVRTLIRWAGDNPEREGLRDTPARVVAACEEFFWGYRGSPAAFDRCPVNVDVGALLVAEQRQGLKYPFPVWGEAQQA